MLQDIETVLDIDCVERGRHREMSPVDLSVIIFFWSSEIVLVSSNDKMS